MRTEQLFEFEQLVSGKSLNLAVRSDSFTSEPNEKLTVGPIRWRNVSRQQGPESCRPIVRGGQHAVSVRAEDRARNTAGVALENRQGLAGLGIPKPRGVVCRDGQHAVSTRAKGRTRNPVGVALESSQGLAGVGLPELCGIV